MYSLTLRCAPEEVDDLSWELWERGTIGVREEDAGEETIRLTAAFEESGAQNELLEFFARFEPRWSAEEERDWIRETERAWPGRAIASRFFLAAPWCREETPAGRIRLIHTPGLACGTGEHPSTRLTMMAFEGVIERGALVADIGTGSGLLAIAAIALGARTAIGCDSDEAALGIARENLRANGMEAATHLVAGSADALLPGAFDVVAANISATVLLSIADDLFGLAKSEGVLVLSGFENAEAAAVQAIFGGETVLDEDGWSCVIARVKS